MLLITVMKVARVLTSKAILYYSNSGNTKAIVEESNTDGFDVYNLKRLSDEDVKKVFLNYKTLIIGTPTLGEGVPPLYFRKIYRILNSAHGKRIGLFGSGQSVYPYFCGALDLLEDVFDESNEVVFVYKFESYPTESAKLEFQKLLNDI